MKAGQAEPLKTKDGGGASLLAHFRLRRKTVGGSFLSLFYFQPADYSRIRLK